MTRPSQRGRQQRPGLPPPPPPASAPDQPSSDRAKGGPLSFTSRVCPLQFFKNDAKFLVPQHGVSHPCVRFKQPLGLLTLRRRKGKTSALSLPGHGSQALRLWLPRRQRRGSFSPTVPTSGAEEGGVAPSKGWLFERDSQVRLKRSRTEFRFRIAGRPSRPGIRPCGQ